MGWRTAQEAGGGDHEKLAVDIENELYAHFKSVHGEQRWESYYTDKVKSVKFNLIDPKNPDFRSKVKIPFCPCQSSEILSRGAYGSGSARERSV